MDLCLVQECRKVNLKTCLTVLSQIHQQTMSKVREYYMTLCILRTSFTLFTYMSCLIYYIIHDGC